MVLKVYSSSLVTDFYLESILFQAVACGMAEIVIESEEQ